MTDIDIDINKLTVTHWHWILDLVSWPLNELGTNWELKYRHRWKWLTVREWNWTTFTMILDIVIGHFKAQNISRKSLSIFLFWITFNWNFQQIVKKYSLGEASPWKGWSSTAEQAQAGSLQEKVVTSILVFLRNWKLSSETKIGFVSKQNLQAK